MATKTKTKTKTNKALKAEITKELESQKEIKREENRKLNANLREVIIYTKETCPYCIDIKNKLDDEGIKYTEKEISQENIYYYLSKINLGQSISKLTNWNKSCCSLIRLFCMENFKYSGHWHRDREEINQVVQASFYLKDEKGFKIRKKSQEII